MFSGGVTVGDAEALRALRDLIALSVLTALLTFLTAFLTVFTTLFGDLAEVIGVSFGPTTREPAFGNSVNP